MDLEFGPTYLARLENLPMAELRAKREHCVELEMELSYVRRLAQARIDLIAAESERRHLGLEPATPEMLVGQLPYILGDRSRAGGTGRLPSLLAPSGGAQLSLATRLEEVLPSDRLGTLNELPQEALTSVMDELSALERDVSAQRRALHDIIDRLQEELVRRYRTGEATVDALLPGPSE